MNIKLVILALSLLLVAAYKDGEKVPFYVNTVGPQHSPSTRFQFYSLPYCRPSKIVVKLMSLGELLQGKRYVSSTMSFPFKENVPVTSMCLPSAKDLPPKSQTKFLKAINQEYWFEFLLNDLPMWNAVGTRTKKGEVLLYTHFHFYAYYNKQDLVGVNVTVLPSQSIILPETPSSPLNVPFTYQVTWVPSKLSYENRFDVYGKALQGNMKVHWFSILNSTGLVILGVAIVSLVLVNVLKKDVTRYNKVNDSLPVTSMDDLDDLGWKMVAADVFRPPRNLSFLIASIATGAQLISTIVIVLLLRSMFGSFFKPYTGSGISLILALFVLSSSIGGFVSGYLYKRMGGRNFAYNIVLQTLLWSVPSLTVVYSLSFIATSADMTHALPFTTTLLLTGLLVFVAFPLSILAGLGARHFSKQVKPPVRVSPFPRPIPVTGFLRSRAGFTVLAGFVPFTAIFLELSFVLSSFWSNNLYQLYGVLLLVVLSLFVVVVCVTVTLVYFQLSSEDYRWWTSSFLYGGSPALFVWLYSLFYFFRSEMTGLFQFLYFLGYTSLGCFALFLMLGSIGWFAVYVFVNKVYASIKTD
ncbi:hypothetical protein RCL1_005776 [Eukaryota sp. TZLM3-RCL]